MSIWQAFWFWVLVFTGISIVLPFLALLGWNAYIRLAPKARAWKAWMTGELARLEQPEPPRSLSTKP